MTEEDKLRQSFGCGGLIMLGLIGIVILSLVGLIFPMDILPYPNEILIGIFIIAAIALIITICMWRGRIKDKKKEQDDKADNVLRQHLKTLGDQDDRANKLAQKYNTDESE